MSVLDSWVRAVNRSMPQMAVTTSNQNASTQLRHDFLRCKRTRRAEICAS
jgi:hypothetical protein